MVKSIELNRLQLKTQVLELFKDKTILNFELNATLLDVRGNKETGSGIGVTREVFCLFFKEFLESCTWGRVAKVPSIRHDMSREEWIAVGRIFIAAKKVGYYPLSISPAFMIATLFGERKLESDILLESFKNYVSLEEKENFEQMLLNFEENNEDLLETLSFYKCHRNPSKDSLESILLELAHQEIVQKPRYIANCLSEVLTSQNEHELFTSVEALLAFYEKHKPTAKKVIKSLNNDALNEKEVEIFNHLTRFVKSLSKDILILFLRFVTGADMVPDSITVSFQEQAFRAPVSRTCSNTLFLSTTYVCYSELAEELNNILRNSESFSFQFV